MSLQPAQLVGTWDLVRFTVRSEGRPDRHPFGVQARGRIVYAADGHMMAVLAASGADAATPGALETSHRLAEADKAAAFDAYLSYSGRWRLDGDEVYHDVDLALAPGVAGQTQTRRVALTGQAEPRLTLTYTRVGQSGRAHRFELEWVRPGRLA